MRPRNILNKFNPMFFSVHNFLRGHIVIFFLSLNQITSHYCKLHQNQLGNMLKTKIASTNFSTHFQTQVTENLIIIYHLFSNILFTKLQIVIMTAIALKLTNQIFSILSLYLSYFIIIQYLFQTLSLQCTNSNNCCYSQI